MDRKKSTQIHSKGETFKEIYFFFISLFIIYQNLQYNHVILITNNWSVKAITSGLGNPCRHKTFLSFYTFYTFL